jgi:TolA-binding protein
MPFTVSDFNDLLQLLDDHPQWRFELRQRLMSEDFEALPGLVRELAQAQQRTEQRVEELAQAQQRTEQRLTRLEELLQQLIETQRHFEQRLARLEQRMDKLLYHQKAPSYFGRWLRRVKVLDANDVLDAVEERLSESQIQELLLADLFVRGRARQRPDGPPIWLAIEISAVVDREDVNRAVARAALLRAAGLPALPVVAGESTTEGADAEAAAQCVAILQNGSGELWDEALVAWLPAN